MPIGYLEINIARCRERVDIKFDQESTGASVVARDKEKVKRAQQAKTVIEKRKIHDFNQKPDREGRWLNWRAKLSRWRTGAETRRWVTLKKGGRLGERGGRGGGGGAQKSKKRGGQIQRSSPRRG